MKGGAVASISEEDIRRVREANDIVSVFSDRVPLHQKGRSVWCCCPFHEENTPSCKIDPDTQQWYCFGCHEGGDVFSYVMKSEDISFPDAVRRLADRAGIQITESGGPSIPQSYKAKLKEVCRETQEFYQQQLMRLKTPEADAARAYLSKRGLGGEVPKRWQLGFAPGRGVLIKHLRSCGFNQKEMVDANVVTAYEGRRVQDRFFNRIMFPIFDEAGDCIAFGGRVVGTGEPKYLNSTDTPLFHKSSVLYGMDKAKGFMASKGIAIVVEGYTDVIALHEAGVKNVAATLGTALTKQHIRMLGRHAQKKIIYLFDGDAAGQRAADRALGFIDESMTPEAGRKRIELCACTLPDDLDPADFVAQRGVRALQAQLDEAKPLILYGIDRRIEGRDIATAEGRAAAFEEAIAVLAPIKDSLLAKDYAIQIAGRLHMRENDAIERLSTLRVPPSSDGVERTPDVVPSSTSDEQPRVQLNEQERNRRQFEQVFIGICARNPSLAIVHADRLAQTIWHSKLHAQVSDMLLAIIAAEPGAMAVDIISRITQKIPASAALFVSGEADISDPDAYAAFLAEELAIGDTEEAVETYRAQLKDPASMTAEEYDLLFETVAALQKDLAESRIAHAKQTF